MTATGAPADATELKDDTALMIRRTFDAAFHERMRLLPEWTALDAHAYVHRDFDF